MYLDPSKESSESHSVVELHLPIGKDFKVRKLAWRRQQVIYHRRHRKGAVEVKRDTNQGYYDHDNIHPVPKLGEVLFKPFILQL